MKGPIALLGWGSLLWDTREEFDVWHKPWQCDGPTLRLEFSRVSGSRKGALTLVIDPQNGTPNTVYWALSCRSSLDQVIEDLKKREGTSTCRIGVYSLEGLERGFDHESVSIIRSWANEQNIHGVVWTDLPSNFADKVCCRADKVRCQFSVEVALRYLQSDLEGDAREEALEYICKAPASIQTPLRTAVTQMMKVESN